MECIYECVKQQYLLAERERAEHIQVQQSLFVYMHVNTDLIILVKTPYINQIDSLSVQQYFSTTGQAICMARAKIQENEKLRKDNQRTLSHWNEYIYVRSLIFLSQKFFFSLSHFIQTISLRKSLPTNFRLLTIIIKQTCQIYVVCVCVCVCMLSAFICCIRIIFVENVKKATLNE